MENSKQVQQDNNLSIYERVRSVPKEAKKEIEAGGRKIRTMDNYVMIILDDSEIQEYSDEIFHKWKDSGNESEEIYDRILSFPIENKTPMECMIFLSELKEKLNAKQ